MVETKPKEDTSVTYKLGTAPPDLAGSLVMGYNFLLSISPSSSSYLIGAKSITIPSNSSDILLYREGHEPYTKHKIYAGRNFDNLVVSKAVLDYSTEDLLLDWFNDVQKNGIDGKTKIVTVYVVSAKKAIHRIYRFYNAFPVALKPESLDSMSNSVHMQSMEFSFSEMTVNE